MLKILAGTAKGRVLFTPPKNPNLRPILARVKKSLFDIIRVRLNGTHFLDLYSGTGAVGIEALSRGAHHASFIDHNIQCIRVLKKNLEHLNFMDQASVFQRDVTGDLSFLPKPFDIIFLGPPYRNAEKEAITLVGPTLQAIVTYQLLKSDGLVVAQHHKKENFDLPLESWTLARQNRYGDTVLSFLRTGPPIQ